MRLPARFHMAIKSSLRSVFGNKPKAAIVSRTHRFRLADTPPATLPCVTLSNMQRQSIGGRGSAVQSDIRLENQFACQALTS